MPFATAAVDDSPESERAFLVGLDARTRTRGAGKSSVTAQAVAARDAAVPTAGAPKPDGRPSIPEFDAEESLAELRARVEQNGEPQRPWWREGAGRFANDPVFDEIVQLGREYRESQHPDHHVRP